MGINVELKTINQWIDTYLGVYFDHKIEIPELPYTISKAIKNKIKFDSLKENLIKSQVKMNNELSRYEVFILELKAECNENIHKQEILQNETTTLKNQLLSSKEEIFELQQKIGSQNKENVLNKDLMTNIKGDLKEKNDNFTKYLENIDSFLVNMLDKIKQNNLIVNNFPALFYKSNYPENIKDQISDSLQNLFEILDNFINEYDGMLRRLEEHKELKQEMEKFRRENSLRKEKGTTSQDELKIEDKLNKIINERNELIGNLNNEISLLKNAQLTIIRGDTENIEKLKNLEKKIGNLSNEIDLKEMQIKNQEEMILRRNLEIETLKQKNSLKNEKKFRSISHEKA